MEAERRKEPRPYNYQPTSGIQEEGVDEAWCTRRSSCWNVLSCRLHGDIQADMSNRNWATGVTASVVMGMLLNFLERQSPDLSDNLLSSEILINLSKSAQHKTSSLNRKS